MQYVLRAKYIGRRIAVVFAAFNNNNNNNNNDTVCVV